MGDLLRINMESLDQTILGSTWNFMSDVYGDHQKNLIGGGSFFVKIFAAAENKYSISDLSRFLSRPRFLLKSSAWTSEFLNRVDALLPPQPWGKGVRQEISKQLKCSMGFVSEAISALVIERRRYWQSDGIVYDFDNKVIDPSDPRISKPIDNISH